MIKDTKMEVFKYGKDKDLYIREQDLFSMFQICRQNINEAPVESYPKDSKESMLYLINQLINSCIYLRYTVDHMETVGEIEE